MTTITVGSGLGGFSAIAPQPTYGGAFVTPTRTIYGLKSNKATHDPHIVQGGPYLEYGRIVDVSAAHVQTWKDAKGTMVFDAMSSGLALLLASAFGSSDQLTQFGTTTAYELNGSTGIIPEPPERQNASNPWESTSTYANEEVVFYEGKFFKSKKAANKANKPITGTVVEATNWEEVATYAAGTTYAAGVQVVFGPANGKLVLYTSLEAGNKGNQPNISPTKWQVAGAQSGCCFDMQLGVPTNQGELTPWNYHSCVITKAEFVFDRTGLVSCTLDWDGQQIENTTALITPVTSVTAAPFSMTNAASVFKIGTPGSAVTIPGARKLTFTLQRKLATDRIYLGESFKQVPSTNGLLDIMIAAEMDYTNQAKSVLETFLKNEAQEIVVAAVGAAIGSSGKSNELKFALSNAFIETGGEAPLDGPDIVKNTVNFKATINETNAAPLTANLTTADTTF